MDIFGDFFGYNPASQEERIDEAKRQISQAEFDHVIQDGKVYVSADEFSGLFGKISRLLVLRGILTSDTLSMGAAKGLEVASGVLGDVQSELLRREADAIARAGLADNDN